MKRFLILTIILAALFGVLLTTSAKKSEQIAAAHDGEVACQQCINTAWQNWQVCVDAVNDVGDADCRSQREDAINVCQSTACIYRERQSSALSFLEAITPTGQCQERDPYAKCQDKCFHESELVFTQCMIVHEDQPKCAKQASDYEASCQARGRCP